MTLAQTGVDIKALEGENHVGRYEAGKKEVRRCRGNMQQQMKQLQAMQRDGGCTEAIAGERQLQLLANVKVTVNARRLQSS